MTGEFAIAVHALVYLNHKGTILSSDVLAENVCTNPARVRKVLSKLKKCGLVETKEGLDGGYLFRKEPEEVNLKQISEALEVKLVSSSWRSGRAGMPCLIASGMAGLMDGIYDELNEACLDKLEQITIRTLDDKIFESET